MRRREFFQITGAGLGCATVAALGPRLAWAATRKDRASFQPDRVRGRDFVDIQGSEAFVAGYPVSWWDAHFGLPLHVHHAPAIVDNVRAYREVFRRRYPKASIRFAGKANPHPAVFRLLVQSGEGVYTGSEQEVEAALLAGASPDRIVVNGNAKSDAYLRLAIGRGMLVVCDNLSELDLIGRLSREMRARPRVLQRLSGFQLGDVTAAGSFTAGRWTKFGLPISELSELFPALARNPEVNFQGFHVHIGSPIAALEPYQVVAGRMVEASRAAAQRGYPCRIFDMGGGYPVNYLDRQQWEWLLARVRSGFEAVQAGDEARTWVWDGGASGFRNEQSGELDLSRWTGKRFRSDHPKERMLDDLLTGDVRVDGTSVPFVRALRDLGEPTFIAEPGRSIVEDAGVTLTRVAHVRKVAGPHDLVSIEAGIVSFGDALEYAIPLNRWSLATGCDRRDERSFDAFIAGNLCFTGDMPSRYKVAFPRRPVRGDVLLTWDTGAYNPQFYASNANGFPRPARVLVQADGSVEFIKTRDTLEEIFSLPTRARKS